MIKVWDLFVRLSHWLVVLFVVFAWFSANFGDAEFKWHSLNGYAIFILVVSRIIWGIFGSETARFSHFVKSPFKVVFYLNRMLRGKAPIFLGHNPAGAWMVVILLFTLLFQAITGMFSSDDILAEGPFVYAVSGNIVSTMTGLHHRAFDLLMILIALHIAAVLYHQFFKKEKLLVAMIIGEKLAPKDQGEKVFSFKPFYYTLLIIGLVSLLFYLVLNHYT